MNDLKKGKRKEVGKEEKDKKQKGAREVVMQGGMEGRSKYTHLDTPCFKTLYGVMRCDVMLDRVLW